MIGWKPKGRLVTDFSTLQDGRHVRGYYGSESRTKIKDGVIIREVERYGSFNAERVYVQFTYHGSRVKEMLFRRVGNQGWQHGYGCFELYSINLIKEKTTMANKLMALVRLNKNQRKLQKAGVYDENGNLTIDGQEVLLNLIAKDYEPKLVELVKEMPKKKRKDSDEDED